MEEDFKVEEEEEGLVLAKKERRSFVFIVSHTDDKIIVNRNMKISLGQVYLKWTNYLGEPAEMRLGDI